MKIDSSGLPKTKNQTTHNKNLWISNFHVGDFPNTIRLWKMSEEELKTSRNLLPCTSEWVYNTFMQERKMYFQILQSLSNASDYILSCLKENNRVNWIINCPELMWAQAQCCNYNLCRDWRHAEVILAGKGTSSVFFMHSLVFAPRAGICPGPPRRCTAQRVFFVGFFFFYLYHV